MKNALPILLALALTACGDGGREIVMPLKAGMPAADVTAAERAVEMLIKTCPGLPRYWDDLAVGAPVAVKEATLTDQRERGWVRAVAIELHVAARPKHIPHAFFAAGHRCYYDAAMPPAMGIAVAKSACISLCLDQRTRQSQAFLNPR